MRRVREFGLVFNGLRKNAVCMLVEAGCSYAHVAAIVEMSEARWPTTRRTWRSAASRWPACGGSRRAGSRRELLFGKAADRMYGNGR
jgi:hypothetical protein